MKLSLTVWERTVLTAVFNFAPATERTRPGVLAMQDIWAKLQLTDEEKKAVGYIVLADGRPSWADQEHEAEIEFSSSEWYYVLSAPGWGGWPLSENSNALWNKIDAVQKVKK